MSLAVVIIAAGSASAATLAAAWWLRRRAVAERLASARAEAKAALRGAGAEAAAARRKAVTDAREESLELRARADEELVREREAVLEKGEQVGRWLVDITHHLGELEQRSAEIDERFATITSLKDRARSLKEDAAARHAEGMRELEARAGVTAAEVADSISARWREEANASAAFKLRALEQGLHDADCERAARWSMQVAVSRYRNHFLTERSISRLTLGEGLGELLIADDAQLHRGLEEVANVQLLIGDEGDNLRLDGLDGVGREVARRAINRLNKKPAARAEAVADPVAWTTAIRTQLDREIHSLGTKAFSILEIPRAHTEIVDLVGALNYRTSYTQNQWRHAVEAAFLAGMIAGEIGLDVKLARRAALIHDIGKALTHKIEGSHAVIGAEIARRRGEDELVANAIGAHHLDEPMSSAYAYLIAAADAMSGGRPGARREFADGYTSRLHDLERIGCSFGGVDRAHAVHGGRELRVYVRENEVSDERAAELATEVAARLSEELTFPGQIKVTAIRAYEAVSTAS